MIQLNARFFAVNAGLLTAALSIACGVAPTAPSDPSSVAALAETSTAGTLATTQGASFRPIPNGCRTTARLVLVAETVDKLSVLVTSNYVSSRKGCPSLTWTLSTKHDFVPSVDKLGRDIVMIYSGDLPVDTTVTAFVSKDLTASIDVVLPQ